MSVPIPTYRQGGTDTPLGTVTCPNNTATGIIGPDERRILLAVCAVNGETVILQPQYTDDPNAGFCVTAGNTFLVYATRWGAWTALGWQIYNKSGNPVIVSVGQLLKQGWTYPP